MMLASFSIKSFLFSASFWPFWLLTVIAY